MTYDVDAPKERYNTDVTREYYTRYRPEPEKHSILYHWSVMKGPDSNMLLKTTSGAIYGSVAGTVAALHSNIMYTKGPFTVLGIAATTYKHGVPWIVVGATYGLTVSMITQLRDKESPVNHALAGYAAGTMLGSWYKWPMMGVWTGGLMAIAGGFIKYWYDNDMLHDKPIRPKRLFNTYRRGWFMMDRPNAEGEDDAEKDVSFRFYKP